MIRMGGEGWGGVGGGVAGPPSSPQGHLAGTSQSEKEERCHGRKTNTRGEGVGHP